VFEKENAKLAELNRERDQYLPVIERVEAIDNEISNIKQDMQSRCSHPNAYTYHISEDSFEGRNYAEIFCPDCFDKWEERIRRGRLPYPMKGGDGDGGTK
jgi:hypothetical protein